MVQMWQWFRCVDRKANWPMSTGERLICRNGAPCLTSVNCRVICRVASSPSCRLIRGVARVWTRHGGPARTREGVAAAFLRQGLQSLGPTPDLVTSTVARSDAAGRRSIRKERSPSKLCCKGRSSVLRPMSPRADGDGTSIQLPGLFQTFSEPALHPLWSTSARARP